MPPSVRDPDVVHLLPITLSMQYQGQQVRRKLHQTQEEPVHELIALVASRNSASVRAYVAYAEIQAMTMIKETDAQSSMFEDLEQAAGIESSGSVAIDLQPP